MFDQDSKPSYKSKSVSAIKLAWGGDTFAGRPAVKQVARGACFDGAPRMSQMLRIAIGLPVLPVKHSLVLGLFFQLFLSVFILCICG